jgi:hypothetical protein
MCRKAVFILLILIVESVLVLGQGRGNNWLIGYNSGINPPYTSCERAKIFFSSGTGTIQQQQNRKMNFSSTEGIISDKNGNLLMSSNGIWIANAFGDTILNGSRLNPGPYASTYYSINGCLPIISGNLIIPFPADSNKYILFHLTGNYNAALNPTELFYSVIDMTLAGGLGGVTLKNQIAFQDTLMPAFTAVKHANGRDWWIVLVKDNSDVIFSVLVTPSGIQNVTSQSVGGLKNYHTSIGQIEFSPDGKKFAYSSAYIDSATFNTIANVRLFDFDRCSGQFSNYRYYSTSNYYFSVGLAFSPNSKYLYASTTNNVFQINTDTINATIDTVAVNDGYFSPINPFQSDFFTMYRAKDNRIYITSGNSVVDLHYINHPDSAGLACDVHQHAFHLPCFNDRSVPNHPNYELGADSGSVCDTLQLAISGLEFKNQNSLIRINPNPVEGFFYINYDLNIRDNALFVLHDSFGNEVLKRNLYGTMKTSLVHCDELMNGVYFFTSTVRNKVVDRGKIVVVK